MARLIFISPYMKGGRDAARLAHRTRYFATREGVQLLKDDNAHLPVTKKQQQYIRRLLRSFPEARELPEHEDYCALPGFVDSKNEEKTERNAGYLVVSQSGGGMLRQGTRKGIRRTPANRGMRAHRIVKSLDISEDVCHGLCP